ncbi:putative serine/threonine protein kinase [Blattamonas nauphoetae]|uniref:Serine/threonine protein kinase n=1 Tax=Blattamonas nauphoetae TaxID=2049346 RepID=A0ABQ9YEI5_9EUKA|nr:putative serine/threonine protein kinase [Blattamonas nauphoetae]
MAETIIVPDGYSFVREISSGTFGSVVEMIETSTNTHYAGKMIPFTAISNIERINREVGRLRTFTHPRIIKLKEVVPMTNMKVIVMELGGKSLAEIVKDLTERKVLMAREDVYRVMEDIASALEMMHSDEGGKTAHGDIKMENILIDADGHAKLCDFGAAESATGTSTRSARTTLYVSPDRMNSETGKATCDADVWSLGVVLYWLLFGEPPFKSQNEVKLIEEITSFKPTMIPNSCGEEERALLMRMMDTCAESRITCHQLLHSKSFRCIVNTIEGMWKLKDEEQAKRVEAEEERKKADRERLMLNDELKLQHANLPILVGMESLPIYDETAHSLTPTTLTQIVKLEPGENWRTAFTLPIEEGEWELKIKVRENTFDHMMIGFIEHPLPEDATQNQCGAYVGGMGGDFLLWSGAMWKGGEFKPAGTNRKCDQIGQIAAIRVNMSTREARLFVDEIEQPGIFTNIPSPLHLGLSTGFCAEHTSVEVMWLKQLRGSIEPQRSETAIEGLLEETQILKSQNDELRLLLADLPIWIGTQALKTIDRTAHALTPTTLTQIIVSPQDKPWRTAFTFPINEGEWELKISSSDISFLDVMLGFIRYPLPEGATQNSCGGYYAGMDGEFQLGSGRMWQGGTEVKPIITHKKCNRAGQTAAIRVNLLTREARLFVDEEEQSGLFTDIPSPLCLAISTGFRAENQSVDVLWLKRRRISQF